MALSIGFDWKVLIFSLDWIASPISVAVVVGIKARGLVSDNLGIFVASGLRGRPLYTSAFQVVKKGEKWV